MIRLTEQGKYPILINPDNILWVRMALDTKDGIHSWITMMNGAEIGVTEEPEDIDEKIRRGYVAQEVELPNHALRAHRKAIDDFVERHMRVEDKEKPQEPIVSEYFGLVHGDMEDGFGVSFPDFPGCISCGDDIAQATSSASEALEMHIEGMLEDGEVIPPPSSLELLKQSSSEEARSAIDWVLVPVRQGLTPIKPDAIVRRDPIEAAERFSERFLKSMKILGGDKDS